MMLYYALAVLMEPAAILLMALATMTGPQT